MIRVLHLMGREPDFQASRAGDALRRDLGDGFEIITRTIGRGGSYRNLAAAGWSLRGERFDVVHAWDETALTAAAVGARGPILFSPSRFPSRGMIGWMRAVMSYRDVQVVNPTATQRRIMVEHGVGIERCHLLRPGVDFARVRRRRDPALRASLGFTDDDHVLLAAGESTRAAAHGLTIWAASMLHILDPRQKVLLWGRGENARVAAGLSDKLRQPDLCRVAEARLGRRVEFEELLPAADVVVVSASGPVATLPIAISMAAAMPIVSTVTYTVAELLEDRHTALMVPRHAPRQLAQRILDLRADSQLQWSIADMARTEAYEFFALTRFINQYRTVYRQVGSGQPVEVAEPAPGAGRRFHGRA